MPVHAARLVDFIDDGRPDEALELFLAAVVGMPVTAAANLRQVPSLVALAPTLRYDVAILGDGGLPPLPATPTTVLAGGDSSPWLRSAAQALSEVLRDGRYVELPGQTHAADQRALAAALEEIFG